MLKDYKKVNQSAIDNAVEIKENLWTISGLFDPDTLEEILKQLSIETAWSKVEMQEQLNRQALQWVDNGLADHIWCLLNTLDFSKFGFKPRTVTIWKDGPGYIIGNHYDNDRVIGAMQIYLNDALPELGTWFENNEIQFVKNTGYIMNNNNKAIHGMRNAVPLGVIRYSLYVWFDFI